MRFPLYLDHHATTPVDPRVLEVMLPYFTEKFGNASSINHAYGWEAADAVAKARDQVATLLNVPAKGIVFTSGATEANNLAIKGVMRLAPPGSHLITTAAEHNAVLDPVRRLQRAGTPVTILPVNRDGRVEVEAIESALRPETVLVSVMSANNEVGTLSPIAEIGRLCRSRRVLFHCDAAQSVGRLPLDLATLPIDLLSLSGHKLYGPKGVGVLYVRPGPPRVKLEPLFDGGGHEHRLRSGTLAVPLIVGLGAACDLCRREMPQEAERLRTLRERLWNGLSTRLDGLTRNGHPEERLPGNLHVSVDGVDGEALMIRLKQIAVSSGSACTTAEPEPSHVLRAMGISDLLSRASLRFGIGRFNTEEEIDYAIDYVAETVEQLRALSREGRPASREL